MLLKSKKRPTHFAANGFEPLEALCVNRDRSKVAVIGRTASKIYAIHEDEDHFELLLERGKPRKTIHFSGSIAWNHLRDNLIATTSSNGAIFLWDPESSQSLERSYKAHKQMATKVCFNEFNDNLLISGSKDSTVWLYDLRSAEPSTCFTSNQDDSIRDIQFCMESKFQDTFVTAGDSGTIRFWDARRPDKSFKEFIAHSSQVYSIALNPQLQSKNLIATAGRDKYIRVWDWSQNVPFFLYSVEMMAIVTRVSWCPDNPWHVACCFAPPSGFVSSDNIIYVWDLRRPFIPYASFNAHTKTCTDMSWPRQGNGNTFFSCGKDGRLIMNFMDAAQRPILYTNSVALDASSPIDGIVVAVPSSYNSKRKSCCSMPDTVDPFRRKVPSTLFCAMPTDPIWMVGRTLAYFGENYKCIGGSVQALCEHNAQVAESICKDHLAYAWRMLALLIEQTDLCCCENSKSGNDLNTIGGEFRRNFSANYLDQKRTAGLSSSNAAVAHHTSIANMSDLDNCRRRMIAPGGGGEHQFDIGVNPPAAATTAAASRSAAVLLSGTATGTTNAAAAALISGSLATAAATVQNPLTANLDLFFGLDELNLGGLLDAGSCSGGMFGGETTSSWRTNRRSIVSSATVDLFHINEEAFVPRKRTALNAHRRRRPKQKENNANDNVGLDTKTGLTHDIRKRKRAGRAILPSLLQFDVINQDTLKNEKEMFGDGITATAVKEEKEEENDLDEGIASGTRSYHFGSSSSHSSSSSVMSADENDDGVQKADGNDTEEVENEESAQEEAERDEEVEGQSQNSRKSDDELQQALALHSVGGYDPLPSIKSLLDHYSAIGDVQMCATICSVIGEGLVDRNLVSARQAELWFLNYLELLERLQLWRVSAVLIKSCFRPNIAQLSNESTFVKLWCNRCRSTATRASMRCTKCRQPYNYTCTICDILVRGIWSSCSECGHGGHLEHMERWFAQSSICPAIGCGHQCAMRPTIRQQKSREQSKKSNKQKQQQQSMAVDR